MDYLFKKIIELLKTGIGKEDVRSYFYGVPILINRSALPAISVAPVHTDTYMEMTGKDTDEHIITITYEIDTRSEMAKHDNKVVGYDKLIKVSSGTDDNNARLASSIVSILRTNFTLGNTVHQNNIGIDYYFKRYDLGRQDELITKAVEITVTLKELVTQAKS